jgi:chemotaxis protein MotA
VRKQQSIEVWLVIPLLFAAACLTVGLAMYLSGTEHPSDVVQPVIVVFGGTLAVLLVTFPMAQLNQALQAAVTRGLRGGTAPSEMIRAMMKVCDISRREGLLGVADVRSNSIDVEQACHLIGDAATEPKIQFSLDRRLTAEKMFHQMTCDVFFFTGLYAVLMGLLGSLIRLATTDQVSVSFAALPFVIGVSLAILMGILIGRLRSVHIREMVVVDIAYQGAAIVLDDNNVQRLRSRLAELVPQGLRS